MKSDFHLDCIHFLFFHWQSFVIMREVYFSYTTAKSHGVQVGVDGWVYIAHDFGNKSVIPVVVCFLRNMLVGAN